MTGAVVLFVMVVLAAIALDFVLIRYLARRKQNRKRTAHDVSVFGIHSPALTWLRTRPKTWREEGFQLKPPKISRRQVKGAFLSFVSQKHLWYSVEIVIILVWSMMITLPYLNPNPAVIPAGREYSSAIQTHYLWNNLQECGLCALWNGSTRGGAPAFVDPHGSMLHPLVVLTTLIWGVMNGSKVALVVAFALAGLAQWWLGYLLGVGWLPRLWCALMAVAGGHLSARMELGAFGVIISMVACAFVIPSLLLLAREGSKKASIVLGVSLALAVLSGQGYMQFGLLLTLPAAVLLIPWNKEALLHFGKRFLLSCLIAFLLAAPFLVPFLHFIPNFGKELDFKFESAQALEYIPLNLVIRDIGFYRSESLAKRAHPVLNGNYIGWTAVVLAVLGLFTNRSSQERRTINFLFATVLLAIWVASAVPMRLLIQILPIDALTEMLAGIRNPAQIAGLAVAPLLGISAIGLDRILQMEWPKLQLTILPSRPKPLPITIGSRWLLAIPLIFALGNVRDFGEAWIYTVELDPATDKIIQVLETPDLQWVNPPFGEHDYIGSAVAKGLKMYAGFRTWYWTDHELPEPVLEANYIGPPDGMFFYKVVEGVTIYKAPTGREYARVVHSNGLPATVCQAEGTGGNIDVQCSTSEDGLLIVKEISWNQWRAEIDGQPVPLESGQWLSVSLPAGDHEISFRYRPWDVFLGIGLSLIGIILAVYLWLKADPDTERPDSKTGTSKRMDDPQKTLWIDHTRTSSRADGFGNPARPIKMPEE